MAEDLEEIASSYLDVWGREKRIDPETRRALAQAMGFTLKEKPGRKTTPKIEPGRCYQPEFLERGGRIWGFMVQLYGVRSARNWGIGDFGDLRALVELGAKLGAGIIGVNPLHAGGVSPYSPSSRHALNPLYIELAGVPEHREVAKLREAELVDYEGVARAKYKAFEAMYARFKGSREFSEFRSRSPKELRAYALFEVLREKFGGGWQRWPEEYRNPQSAAAKAFARKNAKRVEFHEYLQWLARTQLDAVQRHALKLGMPVGVYVDLALGADPGGAEVWCDQAAYATGVSCGAPPDEFNPRGQDWGLPPYSPRALRAAGYGPFIDLLRANMPVGGALRLDHVMALERLYCMPRGAKPEKGGYVNYPFRDLLGILAMESRRNRCMVIGEDLGTVPKALRTALNEAGVLSYRPLLFEKDEGGDFCQPSTYPREALVCVSTHDLPTWGGFWQARDLEWREKLSLTVDAAREREQREREKEGLKHAGLDPSPATAHAFLARTPSKVLMVQPEDVFELVEQANLPGSVDEHPNWRRKLPVALERWQSDARVTQLAKILQERNFATKKIIAEPASALVATYRLQFHREFRFTDAIALVPYLARLGVSHVYASPFLKARPGSTHGYDVVDHRRVNPEIGTEAELARLIDTVQRHGMGLVLDVVPNHMGVLGADNPWWQDVLEHGRASPFARFFDIDWTRGKLLLPVLGRHYGEALEKGEIRLERDGHVRYFDHRFPLNPKTRKNLDIKKLNSDSLALHHLLERQHYRLAFWRVASDEINYRRFFEITDLAGVRVEDKEVFEATHALIARLAKKRGVEGVRVDHPDGLYDPVQYLERLGALFAKPWVVVEKILADHERLPEDWPVHGTTGYRFANVLTGVFIDAAAEGRFDRIYQRFTGEQRSFEQIGYDSRMLIMYTTLAADLNMLGGRLARIAAGNRATRDYTESGLRKALAEIAARFPVYRTYVTARGVSDTDRRYIEWAVKSARRASRVADPGVFDFVQSVLTLDAAPEHGARRAAMLAFAMRFQQFTAPVVAKGVEDTAFYRYHRLVALNEVGGEPRHFGFSLKAFHAASEDRARQWPYTMLGTSTHDTKRSEDARARLGVLSELSSTWRLWLRRWSLMNRTRRTDISGESAPSPADEYLYYQNLICIWGTENLAERLKAYMLKAVREAKVHSSWINPDLEYEAALERFVVASLENSVFVKDLKDNLPRIVRLGMLVGLSQALVKVASPGVPDYYQGSELWDFSLVDPDNRRPVDYAKRKKALQALGDKPPSLDELADGRAKLFVIAKGLELRRKRVDLFHGGEYVPLYADGGREENICAFALRDKSQAVIAVAPRLFARLMSEDDAGPIGERIWGDARLALPEGITELHDVMTGRTHRALDGALRLADILATFPVALLTKGKP